MLLLTFAAQVCLTVAGFEAVYLIWGFFADHFTPADAQSMATVLAFLCIGLGGWAAQTLISRGFYALGSTWLPTVVGTAIAVVMTPFYVVLRNQAGAIGLAIASSAAIIVYVMVLGWLQRRRFEREASARSVALGRSPGMLQVSALVGTGMGLLARAQLLQWRPGVHVATVLCRATLLCVFGTGIYAVLARLLGVDGMAEVQSLLLRKLRPNQKTSLTESSYR
jgi:putative peptidoglycan lipid II flippase